MSNKNSVVSYHAWKHDDLVAHTKDQYKSSTIKIVYLACADHFESGHYEHCFAAYYDNYIHLASGKTVHTMDFSVHSKLPVGEVAEEASVAEGAGNFKCLFHFFLILLFF